MDIDIGNVPAVLLVSTSGVIAKIPQCQFDRMTQRGEKKIMLEFELQENTVAVAAPTGDWLTVSAAIGQLAEDIDLDRGPAKNRVLRAIEVKAFAWTGTGRDRRIEPATFALWCSKQRRKAVEAADDEDMNDRVARKRRELGLED